MLDSKNNSKIWMTLLIMTIIFITILATETYWFNKNSIEITWYFFYLKGTIKTSIYVAAYISSALFVSSIFFIKNSVCFTIAITLIIISYLINIVYLLINGYGFGMIELQTAILESGKLSNQAWNAYGTYIIKSILIITPVILLSALVRIIIIKKELHVKTRNIVLIFIISSISTLSIVFKTVNTINPFPVFSNFYITIIYYLSNSIYQGERNRLLTKPSPDAEYKNIIWILDESIAVDYLSINGYQKSTTPYLESIKNQYINLGRASSIANCFAMTNLGLMSGIQINQLPDKENLSLKQPTIFQYAKNAGYKTHYISGQSHDDVLQNYMTKFDLKFIDHFYQPSLIFNDGEVPESDIINKTKKILENNSKNFIFIVKRGAHFHWAGQTPEDKIFFQPRLSKEDGLTIENKEKAINSYLNIVKYRVDDFFKNLFLKTKLLKDKESIIIYTSDHGQSILDGNSKGTHCDSTDPNPKQGAVPLLIFTQKEKERFSNLPKNTFSHFEIFPTTLDLMGYHDHLRGDTFFNKQNSEQVFVSGDIFGRASFYLNNISLKTEGKIKR